MEEFRNSLFRAWNSHASSPGDPPPNIDVFIRKGSWVINQKAPW